MSSDVCKVDDDYVYDRPRWVAELSNGDTIYADDDRPGVEPSSAWQRLRTYCTEGHHHIVRLWVQFRSNRILIEPENAPGYFCMRNSFGVWGEDESYQAYIIGPYDGDGKANLVRYKTPELAPLDGEVREVMPDDPALILRDK